MPETTQSISFPEQNVEIEVLEQISAERLVENMFLASVYSIAVGQDHPIHLTQIFSPICIKKESCNGRLCTH